MKHTNTNTNTNSVPDPRASRANFKRASSEPPCSNFIGATPASAPATAPASALTHLGALCNHLEEASACFIAPPSGFYSDNLRNYNLAPGGEHKLPSPCSVTWDSNSSGPSSDAYQWAVHFLLDDFLEVIEGLFADGRLNATRPLSGESGPVNSSEMYLAGDFMVQKHSAEPSPGGRYELSYTPATMSSIRMFTLVEQEDLGNVRAALARYGVQLPDSLGMRKEDEGK